MTTTPTPTPPPDTIPPVVYEPLGVPLTSGICPPEAPYPASYSARLADNDPTQCLPVDPCLPGGTTLWTVSLCTPEAAPVDTVTPAATVAAESVAPPPPQLPSTGLGSLEAALLVIATLTVAAGGALRALAATDRDRPVRSGT